MWKYGNETPKAPAIVRTGRLNDMGHAAAPTMDHLDIELVGVQHLRKIMGISFPNQLISVCGLIIPSINFLMCASVHK